MKAYFLNSVAVVLGIGAGIFLWGVITAILSVSLIMFI